MIGHWRFVSRKALELLHDESLAEHGGRPGLRDEGLLEVTLARPHQLIADGDPDLAALAAAYGFGLVRNHAFVNGNKRVAFLVTGLFVALNGQRLVTGQADATLTMFGLACGDLSEDDFAQWLRERLQPHPN